MNQSSKNNDSSDNIIRHAWTTQFVGVVMSVAILASSWFLNQAWNRIKSVEDIVHRIELNEASAEGNKFTFTDWSKLKASLDNKDNELDRRIMRLEDNSTVIKDSLLEIKASLNKQRQ